jgi:hypothetical protein
VILDASDVRDFTRVSFWYHWKDQDSILRPHALMKFDLSDVPANAMILSASLHFHTEATQAGGTIGVYHVADDGWDFLMNTAAELHGWPTDHLIQSYAAGTTGWRVIPITAELAGEAVGDRVLSLKWEDGFAYLPERITSPSSSDSRHRPFIMVNYVPMLPSKKSDLTLGPCDVRVSDVTPAPGQPLQVTVTVHNIGPEPATSVEVQLFDGSPENGVLLGSRTIASIGGGGGASDITFSTSAASGRHRLTAIVDPANLNSELDESNNQAFNDLHVLGRYDLFVEGFEQATASGSGMIVWHGAESGMSSWIADADVPYDPDILLARRWRVAHTRTEAFEGHGSLAMFFDGGSDDGTVWVERWIQADPGQTRNVVLRWAFGIESNNATAPVYFIGPYDPEVESDFEILVLQDGWAEYSVSEKVQPSDCARIWVAVGFTVLWETEVQHFLDDIEIEVRIIGGPACPADFDGDGTVGASDLAQLLGSWGPCDDCEDCPADFNGDCAVNAADLAQVLGAWGMCP